MKDAGYEYSTAERKISSKVLSQIYDKVFDFLKRKFL
jgi:hypothetical protein